MTCNNLKLDFVNKNAYFEFDEIMFICPQGIMRKRNFCVDQGP